MALLPCLAGLGSEALGETGKWVGEAQFSQANVACFRGYVCTTGQDVLHGADKRVVTSARRPVTGVCSAGDGPVGSCNYCLTNPPSEPCEWHLEKR